MRKITLLASAMLLLASLSAPLRAETTSIAVPYGDLNLASPAGMETLDHRIHEAVKRVCGEVEVRDLHDGLDQERCLVQARTKVTVQVAQLTRNDRVLALNTR
jgi:UrcA family protein